MKETIVQKEYYYNKQQRVALFEKFEGFIKSRNNELYLHVVPFVESETKKVISKEQLLIKSKQIRSYHDITPDLKVPIVREKGKYSNNKSLYGER